MPARFGSFETYCYTNACHGYPCLAPVSQNELIVSDWSGNLFCVVISPFSVSAQKFVASEIAGGMVVNDTLRSLAIGNEAPMLCVVATRGNHAAMWDRTADTVVRIVPNNGPVSSVAWIQNDELLLLGTGHYPLSVSTVPQARIEVWKPDTDGSSFICRMALPGVCVDAITVSEAEEGSLDVVAFSGMESQDRGFISILDNMLVPKAFFDVPFAMVHRLECTERFIFVAHSGKVRAISRKDGSEMWCHDVAGNVVDFAYDCQCDELLLSNGELISARDGEVVEKWPVMANCCCVRPRPEGGFFGVSEGGIIGVWSLTS